MSLKTRGGRGWGLNNHAGTFPSILFVETFKNPALRSEVAQSASWAFWLKSNFLYLEEEVDSDYMIPHVQLVEGILILATIREVANAEYKGPNTTLSSLLYHPCSDILGSRETTAPTPLHSRGSQP